MSEKGQSLVELAISLVFLMFLLSGAVEFGIIFFQYVQLRDAAQEGALYGSMTSDVAEIENRARNSSYSPIDLRDEKIAVIASVADPAGNPKDISVACEGDALTVTVSFSHHIFMPFLPQILGRGDIPLHGRVTDTVLFPECK